MPKGDPESTEVLSVDFKPGVNWGIFTKKPSVDLLGISIDGSCSVDMTEHLKQLKAREVAKCIL